MAGMVKTDRAVDVRRLCFNNDRPPMLIITSLDVGRNSAVGGLKRSTRLGCRVGSVSTSLGTMVMRTIPVRHDEQLGVAISIIIVNSDA